MDVLGWEVTADGAKLQIPPRWLQVGSGTTTRETNIKAKKEMRDYRRFITPR